MDNIDELEAQDGGFVFVEDDPIMKMAKKQAQEAQNKGKKSVFNHLIENEAQHSD